MSDFSKLKSYLSENNSSSSSNAIEAKFNNAKANVLNFFNKNIPTSSSQANLVDQDEQTTDGWFKEADSDPWLPKLSKKQRIIGFMLCVVMGAFCMFLASLYIPVIVLKSRKFVLLFSLGSVFFLASFSLLWGVKNHIKHLMNPARLPFTITYFSTLIATIYYAMIVKSVVLTLIFAFLQISTLFWYVFSYLPGGMTGFKFFAKVFTSLATKTVSSTLPV